MHASPATAGLHLERTASNTKHPDVMVVVLAWLMAGTLDIAAAVTYYPLTVGARPIRILQGIASGVLGRRAFDGGAGTAALGLFLHYVIAFIWTLLFFVAARRFRVLTQHTLAVGVAYGVVVWAVMNLIVVPLSSAGRGPFKLTQAIVAAVILMICVGIPIAGIVGAYERSR